MKRIFTYLSFIFLLVEVSRAQQDAQYSQYMFNQLVINPAYAGSRDVLNSVIDLRKQWVSLPGAPQTGSFSLHGPIPSLNIGLGGHLVTETIGPSKWTAAAFDFAYHFRLGKGKLSLGLSAGAINYNLNLTQNNYENAGEVIPSQNLGPRTRFDMSTGFYYYTKTFYIGGAATHVNGPNLYNDVYQIPSTITGAPKSSTLFFSLRPHVFLYAGKGFSINQNLIINPSIMLKTDNFNGSGSMDLNCNFLIHQKLWLGLSARLGYGVVALFQFNITDKLRIGYSYDQSLGRLSALGQSSHEIMLGYNFSINKPKMVSPRYL